jgi:hypothetical protein
MQLVTPSVVVSGTGTRYLFHVRSFCKKKRFTFTRKSLIYCAVSVNPIFYAPGETSTNEGLSLHDLPFFRMLIPVLTLCPVAGPCIEFGILRRKGIVFCFIFATVIADMFDGYQKYF